jgi:predicted patatin/cPLA2 family phospholipase
MKLGLVLEGGGLRGIYTVGVLDCLLDNHIMADYCIGVSAGACNGVSYVSKQRGRNLRVNLDYIKDPRYIGLGNMKREGSVFGMHFIFHEIPEKYEPFDYDTFFENPCEFITVVTDVETGKPAYFDKEELRQHDNTILEASSSIPGFAPVVYYKGKGYLDGGTTDSIPVRKALEDGCDKVIVVRTRDRGFRKKPEGMSKFYHKKLKDLPEIVRALEERHVMYNETVEEVDRLEKEGKVLVLAPEKPLHISRFERNLHKLKQGYCLGYEETARHVLEILEFIQK